MPLRAERRARDLRDRVDGVERRQHAYQLHSQIHDVTVCREKAQQHGTKDIEGDRHDHGGRHFYHEHLPCSLAHAVRQARAVILPDEGRDGRGERLVDHPPQAVHLAIRGPRGHFIDPHAVDRGLQDHVGDGKHTAGNRGRQADRQDLLQDVRLDAEPGEPKAHLRRLLHEEPRRHHRAEGLAEHGRDRRAENAHPEDGDEQRIENDIGAAAADQDEQRPLGVAHRPQDTGAHVVKQREYHARHQDPDVQDGGRHEVRRRLEQAKQRLCEKESDCTKDTPPDKSEGVRRVECVIDSFRVIRPEGVRYDDGRARRQAHKEAEQEVQDLSKLPSKEQLIGQVVDMLLSPVNDVTNGLSGNLHALLDGVADKANA